MLHYEGVPADCTGAFADLTFGNAAAPSVNAAALLAMVQSDCALLPLPFARMQTVAVQCCTMEECLDAVQARL